MKCPRAFALALALPVCGCADEVDFVAAASSATGARDAGYITDVRVAEPCAAGAYVGEFWTVSGPVSLSGSISFALRIGTDQDVLTLERDSKLFGTGPDGKTTIEAKVIGGGRCLTGEFNATLVDGVYRPDGIPAEFPFEGTVTGVYFEQPDGGGPSFVGDWKSTALGQVVATGNWYAFYLPPPQ